MLEAVGMSPDWVLSSKMGDENVGIGHDLEKE